MPVIRPPILGVPSHDSWMNQVTQVINTQLVTSASFEATLGGAEGAVGLTGPIGPTGADGVEGPHYAEVTLYSDPAVSSPPSAPTATITWFTGVLSSITAGWSQTPPTIDPTSTDTVYYSKIIFKDAIAPFATTTETGNTPVALYDFTSLTSTYLPLSGGTMTGSITMTALGTVDGVDISERDGVLTATTATANAALPLAGGTMTGTLGVPTVDFGDWTITESSGSLYFATLGVNKMKLTAAGDLEIVGNITELATIT